MICQDVTVPANTPKSSPVRIPVQVPPGVLRKVWVRIPPGHAGLAHLILRHGETQIIPYYGDIHGDDELLIFDEVYEFKTDDTIVFEAWNDDSSYDHTFIVRLLILPKIVAYPELAMFMALKKMLEAMGLE